MTTMNDTLPGIPCGPCDSPEKRILALPADRAAIEMAFYIGAARLRERGVTLFSSGDMLANSLTRDPLVEWDVVFCQASADVVFADWIKRNQSPRATHPALAMGIGLWPVRPHLDRWEFVDDETARWLREKYEEPGENGPLESWARYIFYHIVEKFGRRPFDTRNMLAVFGRGEQNTTKILSCLVARGPLVVTDASEETWGGEGVFALNENYPADMMAPSLWCP